MDSTKLSKSQRKRLRQKQTKHATAPILSEKDREGVQEGKLSILTTTFSKAIHLSFNDSVDKKDIVPIKPFGGAEKVFQDKLHKLYQNNTERFNTIVNQIDGKADWKNTAIWQDFFGRWITKNEALKQTLENECVTTHGVRGVVVSHRIYLQHWLRTPIRGNLFDLIYIRICDSDLWLTFCFLERMAQFAPENQHKFKYFFHDSRYKEYIEENAYNVVEYLRHVVEKEYPFKKDMFVELFHF